MKVTIKFKDGIELKNIEVPGEPSLNNIDFSDLRWFVFLETDGTINIINADDVSGLKMAP